MLSLLFADGPDLPMAKLGKTELAAKAPLAVLRKDLRFMRVIGEEGSLLLPWIGDHDLMEAGKGRAGCQNEDRGDFHK